MAKKRNTKTVTITGFGGIGHSWLRAINQHPDFELIGIIDIDTEMLENVESFGIGLDEIAGRLIFLVVIEEDAPVPPVPKFIEDVPVRLLRAEQAMAYDGGLGCCRCHTDQMNLPVKI